MELIQVCFEKFPRNCRANQSCETSVIVSQVNIPDHTGTLYTIMHLNEMFSFLFILARPRIKHIDSPKVVPEYFSLDMMWLTEAYRIVIVRQ